MNQSYKTIFSKVHQCFVVVSELTKSHGKGSTSVNCGAKAKGRRVALAFAIALSVTEGAVFTMPQVASAEDIVITSGSVIINDDTHKADVYYLNGSNITFTVNANGAVNSISGNTDDAVSGNTVTINGGTVKNAGTDWTEYPAGSGNLVGKPNLVGGFSTSGAVTGNQVSIMNAVLGGDYPTVYGGHSLAGNVSKNSVIVESKNPNLYVYGGSSETGVAGGDTAADGNIVTVKSGEVNYVAGGSSTSGDVKNNKAVIEGGTVHGTVYGGDSAISGGATGNTVSISGGLVEGSVYGGYSAADATGNTVSISGGLVKGSVYGGDSTAGDATGNTVSISGGLVKGSVYGGDSTAGDATGNTVSINGGVVEGSVYGGGGDGDLVTDNTLQLEAAGLFAQEIKNFETVRLAGTLAWNDGATVLKAGKFADNETTDAGKKTGFP